jgi:PhnB protein
MTMTADETTVQAIPEGFHSITPSMVVVGAANAIAFYIRAFDAVEVERATGPDGERVMHATISIGNSKIMLNDEFPEWGVFGPGKYGGAAVSLHLYVEDADATFDQAVAAGATPTMPMSDAFWGDRYGQVKDPFGHHWSIATHKQAVNDEELKKAVASMEGCAP